MVDDNKRIVVNASASRIRRRASGEVVLLLWGVADTVDHVPSKVFLDKPYPENLPVVPCCKKCNREFSLDEEYVTVLFECVRWHTFDPNQFRREKVRKIVEHNPTILQTVRDAVHPLLDGHNSIDPENARLNRVLT